MDKGYVGKSTAGDRVKRAHRGIANDGGGTKISLKSFARTQIKLGIEESLVQDAKDWFECKAGALNAKRSDTTEKRLTEEKMAKKAAKSKKK